jgi:hypothetical protein
MSDPWLLKLDIPAIQRYALKTVSFFDRLLSMRLQMDFYATSSVQHHHPAAVTFDSTDMTGLPAGHLSDNLTSLATVDTQTRVAMMLLAVPTRAGRHRNSLECPLPTSADLTPSGRLEVS